MVGVAAVIGALTVLPEIVRGVDSIVGLFGGGGGGTPPVTAPSNIAPSGSGIGAVVRAASRPVSAGTSVGPIIEGAGAILTALPPIISAVQQTRAPAPVTGFGSPFGQQGIAAMPTNGVRTMSQRQFILATARAAHPGATAKKILRSARECGIELAAATFGLSVLDVCFLIAQPPTRRPRGISAADVRRTRSTLRKVANIQHDFAHFKPAVRRRKAHH